MAKRSPGEIPHYVLDIFEDKPIAYLTTMRPDGRMSTNPVAALLRDGKVLVSTTKDRKKIRNLRADPRVTVCVVHRNNPNRPSYSRVDNGPCVRPFSRSDHFRTCGGH